MLTEVKILFENIKHFRHLITEGVGEAEIIKAIQNHEWLYLYYGGDGKHRKGSRTIRPYVLGIHKQSGKPVLRAWQDNPKNSYDFDNRATRKDSKGHDYWVDGEGEKPGWRMFNLDKITQVYPIGRKFNNSDGSVMIPAGYHEGGDDDMSDVQYYVSTKKQPEYVGKHAREYTGTTKTRSEVNKERWDSIRAGNKNKAKITAADVTKLRDVASRVIKKSRSSFLVTLDDRNNFRLITAEERDRERIPDTAIYGSLAYLYDSLVKQNAPADEKFFKTGRNKLEQDFKNKGQSEIKETGLPTIPFEKKTFFK